MSCFGQHILEKGGLRTRLITKTMRRTCASFQTILRDCTQGCYIQGCPPASFCGVLMRSLAPRQQHNHHRVGVFVMFVKKPVNCIFFWPCRGWWRGVGSQKWEQHSGFGCTHMSPPPPLSLAFLPSPFPLPSPSPPLSPTLRGSQQPARTSLTRRH